MSVRLGNNQTHGAAWPATTEGGWPGPHACIQQEKAACVCMRSCERRASKERGHNKLFRTSRDLRRCDGVG